MLSDAHTPALRITPMLIIGFRLWFIWFNGLLRLSQSALMQLPASVSSLSRMHATAIICFGSRFLQTAMAKVTNTNPTQPIHTLLHLTPFLTGSRPLDRSFDFDLSIFDFHLLIFLEGGFSFSLLIYLLITSNAVFRSVSVYSVSDLIILVGFSPFILTVFASFICSDISY